MNWSLVPNMSAPEPLTVKTPPLYAAEPAGDGPPTSVSNHGVGRMPGALTETVTDVLWVAEVAVPVTVTGYEPGATDPATVKVRVEEPPAVTEVGLKPAVMPEGKPLTESATHSALPEATVVEMLVDPLVPDTTGTVFGAAPIEKSLVVAADTLRVTDVVCVAEAAVPLTVIG